MSALTVFKNCGEHPLLRSFRALLEAWEIPSLSLLQRWAALMGELGSTGQGFFPRVRKLAFDSDNPFTLMAERGLEAGAFLTRLARNDLDRLGRLAAFDIPTLGFNLALYLRSLGLEDAAAGVEAEARSLWQTEGQEQAAGGLFGPPAGTVPGEGPQDQLNKSWGGSLEVFAAHIRQHGAGILSSHGFFRWVRPSGHAAPGFPRHVLTSDPISLADLSGYRSQRSLVIDNTLSFLEGKAANNLLLYGDRGTGKSATVKAVCREYMNRGLRLLELRKEDMGELPTMLEFTASRGLKFIIFIDDLSFENLDDSFTGLKALLEGGVEGRPPNTLIYATSNRRHLVRERPDRTADTGIRSFDTMQEQLSLSDRFGLTVFFTAPSQEEYLEIARFIAEKRGLVPDGKFREDALRWEKWFNGRSPRTASQFVAWLSGAKPFPWEKDEG
jgi:predicted AAA+ superfamily ATPase